jgi:hypothetical protein
MKQLQERALTTSAQPDRSGQGGERVPAQVPLWRLNLVRVGYLVLGLGLAVKEWPVLVDARTDELQAGTVVCMLVAMSLLAWLGLRYPLRLLPILLFEVAWKLIWLGVVALPLWWDGELEGAALTRVGEILWVVIIIAVIPWRHVLTQYVRAPGAPWRGSR